MTIHNDRTNIRENLNNIVKSDNTGQVYRSAGSEENKEIVDPRAGQTKFTNKIDPENYEEMK